MVRLDLLETKPNKICAIDASTNNLAFAIFEGKDLKEFGKINFVGKNTYNKLSDAVKKTKAFFALYKDVDAVVVEHTIFLNSAKTVSDLALVQGAMLGGISLNGVNVIKSINPIAWQTFLGNQRLSKDEKDQIRNSDPNKTESWYKTREREFRKQRTINIIFEIYGKVIEDNDIADAVGVGHYAVNNWNKLS
jgi:Holliday junction resolvasome RuvABC endonuclease subunit